MSDKNELNLIRKLLDVDCQIMKTGYKYVEIEYFKCSCDEDQIYPICKGCAESCHKDHQKTIWPSKKEVCQCGLNNHVVEETEKPNEELTKRCIFNDLPTNTYFQTSKQINLCIYCKEYCIEEEEKAKISFAFIEGKKTHPCDCKKHKYLKDFYRNLNDLAVRSKYLDLGGIDILKYFNLLLGNEKCFNILYKEFIRSHEKLCIDLDEQGYSLQDSNTLGSYFLAIQNFATFTKNIKYLNYFTDKLEEYFDFKFVYKLLSCDFDITKKRLWELKNNVLIIFRKIYFHKLFNFSPFIKVRDIENLDPLQRLLILSNVKENEKIQILINDKDLNVIDSILKLINKFIEIKGKQHKVYFQILRNLYSICKNFIKLNLFTHDQINKFCSLNDEMIYNFSKKKANLKNLVEDRLKLYVGCESELLIPVMKALIFIVFYHNDTQVYKYLRENFTLEDIEFYHSHNDTVKVLIRNNVNLSNYIKNNYHILEDQTTKKCMKKLLDHSLHLTSLSTIKDDNYLLGLRRIFDKSKESNIKYISGDLNPEETRFISFLRTQSNEIEDCYQSFYNSQFSERELVEVIIKSINDLFEEIGMTDYEPEVVESLVTNTNHEQRKKRVETDPNTSNKNYKVITQINQNNTLENSSKKYKFKLLINKSLYLFTVVKSVKILSLMGKKDQEKSKFKEELLKEILRLLFFICDNDPDNCLMILMSDIIYLVVYLNEDQIIEQIRLIFNCLYNLKKYSFYITSPKSIFKFIKLTLNITKNHAKRGLILKEIFKVMIVLEDIPTLHTNYTLLKTRNILKKVYQDEVFQNLSDFYLMNVVLDNGEKYDEKHDPILSQNVYNVTSNSKKSKSKSQKSQVILGDNQTLLTFKNYDLKLLHKIYLNFLYLVNFSFDCGSSLDETEFLNKILKREQIIKILQRLNLKISVRIELIKFYRMVYMDFIIDRNKTIHYNSVWINPIIMNDNLGIKIENGEYYKLLHGLISVRPDSANLDPDFNLFRNELMNFSTIIEHYPDISIEELINYFENGLILPLYVLSNKFMSLLFNHKGYDYLKFYELVYYILTVKKFLFEKKEIINKKGLVRKKTLFKTGISKLLRQKMSIINSTNFSEEEYKKLKEDIKVLEAPKFEVLNYKLMNDYLEKHFYNFVIKPNTKSLRKFFSKKIEYYSNEKQMKLFEKFNNLGLLKTDYEKKILKLLFFYENSKLQFSESAFAKNLSEINIQFNSSYRKEILLYFFFLINDDKLSYKYQGDTLMSLLKLLQYDTANSQKEIFEIFSKNKNLINFEEMVSKCINSLMSLIFASCNPSITSIQEDHLFLINIIKILKYLCEEHNKDFQRIFFNELKFKYLIDQNKESNISLFELMLSVVSKLIILSKWDKLNTSSGESEFNYYYDVYNVILELLIEMIQGTSQDNLKSIITVNQETYQSMFHSFLYTAKLFLLKDNFENKILFSVRYDLINFIMAFLEEKNVPKNIIDLIQEDFSPFDIMGIIVISMKILYINYLNEGKTDVEQADSSNFQFDKTLYEFFKDKFNNDELFSKKIEFKFANRFFHYLKIIVQFKNEEAENLLGIINNIHEDDLIKMFEKYQQSRMQEDIKDLFNEDNLVFDEQKYENYFAIKFFEEITRKVDIFEDGKIVTVLFTKNPKISYLSVNTKNEFLENVSRENRYTKLFGLMENSEYFYDEILYNDEMTKTFKFFKVFNSIHYTFLEGLLFSMNFIINIFILSVYKLEAQDGNFSNITAITIVETVLTVLYGLVIICWFSTKFFLYKIIDEKKFAFNHKIEVENLNILQKVYISIAYSVVERNEITMFLWNFILGVIGLTDKKRYWLFCIQLLCVVNLSQTLKNILRSVTERYRQLLTTSLFVVVAVYQFASIAFFFLSNSADGFFTFEIETPHHHQGYRKENRCQTLLYCFLAHLDIGIRSDGGIGFFMPIVSYKNNRSHFIFELIYILAFFIIIIIILLAAVLGIIIDTNAELNEKSYEINNDKANVCFICGGKREDIEKTNVNFETHVTKDHDMYTYVDYMIGLKFCDPQECNAINSYALDNFKIKSISWIPEFSQLETKEDSSEKNENQSDETEETIKYKPENKHK